jgi:iron(III) transport system ATP-binding protein
MLRVKKVSFAYKEEPVLKNISFEVLPGENVSLIGASGCGKSTLLQIIYGLHHTEGKIFWKDKELLGPQFNLVPGEPFIKYLSQDFDLMPPLSVADNVGTYLSNMYPRKKQYRIKELLQVVEMEELANVKAKDLSGGQQQRIALARALAKEPELLLLDEPFSHIDHFRKNKLRRRLFSYLKERDISCITATHDSTDALSFADKTIVLKNAEIHAMDHPMKLYQNPLSMYVAALFGEVNEIPISLIIPNEISKKRVLIYPHEINVEAKSEIQVRVVESYFKGDGYLIEAELNSKVIYLDHRSNLEKGSIIGITIPSKLIQTRLKN